MPDNRHLLIARCAALLACFAATVHAEIPRPDDAPKPLAPVAAAKSFHLPPGYAMKLIASEPLINEPSGVCWDERGRMIVCELHGYNVEGQYDIDELNRSGKLDMEVRRIQASEAAKQRAKADNFGTVKQLLDTDGDGVMDKADVWADRLPLCYGVVPARGGVIVACPPNIMFLKDADGDGRAEIREVLFSGFGVGQPERGVNAPTWGVDNWIYFGRGHSGGTITGPHLNKPVTIGHTDFRIRADGSAIEPVEGSTGTIGMAFTEGGDRFVTDTTHPALFVTPLPWRYLTRNADLPAPALTNPETNYNQVFPQAPAHPWRVKREQHADYFAFYRRYSLSDAAASGYFTSGCSPLVYQDSLMPPLRGQYFVCEPAQNLVHRARIEREGTRLRLRRLPEEEKSEFLTSSDPWFHPIGLYHTPDGSIAIVDFYREIIEDYSAIPRHLQQQYGVVNGRDRGRIWLLTQAGHKPALSQDMASLDDATLTRQLQSDLHWRRLTARRLLIERQALKQGAKPDLPADAGAALATMFALEGNDALTADDLLAAWHHPSADVRKHALQIADRDFAGIGSKLEKELLAIDSKTIEAPQVLLQMTLSLGNSASPQAIKALANLARAHGNMEWMDAAIASSAMKREAALLTALAATPGKAARVMETLAGVIASRGDAKELATVIAALETAKATGKARDILNLGLENSQPVAASEPVPAPTAPNAGQLAALEKRLPAFVAALNQKHDVEEGRALFTAACSVCHRSHGIGVAVGPDLDGEFQRAPEVILRDVLFPHEAQRPGFETVMAKTQRGETLIGIATSDSPTSVTLRLPGGSERAVLRKRAAISTVRNVSLMPAAFGDGLTTAQIANIIAFLRQPHAGKPNP